MGTIKKLYQDQLVGGSGSAGQEVYPVTSTLGVYDDQNNQLQGVLDKVTTNLGLFTCGTAAATAAKTVSTSKFVLMEGGSVKIKFTYANSADSPTLAIGSTAAKPIMFNGSAASASNSWGAGEIVEFFYDGTNWVGNSTSVSVSQNTETGHTDINIGSDSYPVASVDDVSQLGQKIEVLQSFDDNLIEGVDWEDLAVLSGGGLGGSDYSHIEFNLEKGDTILIHTYIGVGTRCVLAKKIAQGLYQAIHYNVTGYIDYKYVCNESGVYAVSCADTVVSQASVRRYASYMIDSLRDNEKELGKAVSIEPLYYHIQAYDKDFVGNASGYNWELGGAGYLIRQDGKIYVSASWFTSNLIHWGDNILAYCGGVKSIVQYNDAMEIVEVSFFSDIQTGYFLQKAVNAKYFKISTNTANSNYYVNFDKNIGNAQFVAYRFDIKRYVKELEQYILSESYRPNDMTWTDGLPNSPINVWYPNGTTGTITFTRVASSSLVNSITANMTVNGYVITERFAITRDPQGNITKILVTTSIALLQ